MRKEGLVKSLKLFIVFILIWTPYRYVTGMLGWGVLTPEPLPLLVESVVKLAVSFGLVYLFLRRFGDSWEDVGISRRGIGESVSLAALGSLILLLVHLAMGGKPNLNLLGTLHLFLVVGPAEELVDRGYYFSMTASDLGGRWRFWGAASISSLLFALSHLPIDLLVAKYGPGDVAMHLLSVFFAGMVLAGYYYFGWNVAGPSILHAVMDVCGAYITFKESASQFMATGIGMTAIAVIPVIWWFLRVKLIRTGSR